MARSRASAFIAGLALAYAYLRGGLLASILLHFTVNMFSGAVLLAEGDIALLLALAAVTIAVATIGSGFFAYYCIYFVNLISERFTPRDIRAQPPLLVPIPEYPKIPLFAVACPYCGWNESAYSNGRFRCLNCGKER